MVDYSKSESSTTSPWQGVPLKRAAEMLGVKAKTLHNRISRGDFREGEDFRKPMGRVLMSLDTVQRLLNGTHPCQRRRRVLNGQAKVELEMASVFIKDSRLVLQLRIRGVQLREALHLRDTAANRKWAEGECILIERELVSRLLWKKGKAYSLGIPKTTGSWGESDRGGIRLCENVTKDGEQWKSYSVGIG